MNPTKRVTVFAMLAAIALFATGAWAQATRTWVSGVGDDANPCSRTAPCKTFAGAISKTAARGEIDALDPGGFGAVTITKSITISGDGTMAGVLVSGTNGIVVSAGATDVVILRNLHIEGVGAGLNGIRFLAGGELHVEDSEIRGFTQQAIDIQTSGADASFSAQRLQLRNNAGGAIYVHPTAPWHVKAMVDRVSMYGNGRGVRVEDGANVEVRNSVAAGNTFNGFVALASAAPAFMTLDGSSSSQNGAVGVYAGALSTVFISNLTIAGNNVGLLDVGGGAMVSFVKNPVGGNAWDGVPTTTLSRK
jgi:hypothetical protein